LIVILIAKFNHLHIQLKELRWIYANQYKMVNKFVINSVEVLINVKVK
jgi:hypothetical protein